MKKRRSLFSFLLLICLNILAQQKPVDLVYPLLDAANSRWFYFSSACRPFGMVNLSPDTQTGGDWGSGYRYNTDTIKGFSHVHAWQLAGISVMPVNYSENKNPDIFSDYYSKFSHKTELVCPGYQSVELDRYHIKAEITSSTRVGFHRYTFSNKSNSAILFNLNGILGPSKMYGGELKQIDLYTLEGKTVNAPTSRRPKDCTVYFVAKLNVPVKSVIQDEKTKNYKVDVDLSENNILLMKVAISYTSVNNARFNLNSEIPGWNFDQVVEDSKNEWNKLLSRIEIFGGTKEQKRRFYTDLWHALQGRRVISDANGAYPDNTGNKFRIGQLPLGKNGKPLFNQYNSDSFWGAQWTINTLWGLVYPEMMAEFSKSLMQYYHDGGLVPRGPSGGNYTYVMTGASTTPFIISAIQKGIVKDSIELIYRALKKNHMPGGIMERAGYEYDTKLGGGLKYYIRNGYVPYPNPDGHFGLHQDGGSLTMEYAYQDWTLAQLAKRLDHQQDYEYFMERSQNYKHIFDKESDWMRPKDVKGKWCQNFDPYLYEHGFIESNAAQSTWFVPQDLNGLAELMGGAEKATNKLENSFREAEKQDFTIGTSHDLELHPEYNRIPINYGNQPSIQTAFIFNHLGSPWLTQYWSRKVVEQVYEGLSPEQGYSGDEDQGLMGSLAVLMKLGLFSMDGGCSVNPTIELGSPVFDKVIIHLNPAFYSGKTIEIKTINNSPQNCYIQWADLNGNKLDKWNVLQQDLVKGAKITLEMGSKPNKSWGITKEGNQEILPEIFNHFKVPQWFTNAKYGIWLHWGPQSIPAKGGGWYARHMYMSPDSIGREKWGREAWQYHRDTYGHQSEFGYKDLCNTWKTDSFNAEKMVLLFKQWGAHYVAILANHHDNFDLFNTSVHKWNSINVGPHRDLVGEFSKAARKYHLKWAATVHCYRANKWFLPAFGADATGAKKGIPYDGNQTMKDGHGKWWEGMDPQQLYACKYPDFEKELTIRHLELVKNYRPDILYFDDQEIPKPMIQACTELYKNSLKKNGKIETIVSVKHPQKGTLFDYEKGVPGKILDEPFQTETTLAEDWFFKPDSLGDSVLRHNVRSLKELLADVISKRGNLLVNVAVRADGSIPHDQYEIMDAFGAWIKRNSEAIYNTIPWKIYGFGGKTEVGQFKERGINSIPWDTSVTRFTQSKDGKILYMFVFGHPQNLTINIKELANPDYFKSNIQKITLIGQNNHITWKMNNDGLKIKLNQEPVDSDCNVFKIETTGLSGLALNSTSM